MEHTAPRSHRLVNEARRHGPAPTGVVYPCTGPSLAGALEAAEAGLIDPFLIGPEHRMREIAEQQGIDLHGCRLEKAATEHESAARAAELARDGRVGMLMKGSLHTDELMGILVSRSAGLRTDRRISHTFVMEIPVHDRLLLVTDAAINIAPDLEAKRHITQNAIDVAHAVGISNPHIAILSAVENSNPAIPSSMHAAELRDMARSGLITGGIVDGPLAFDNMISQEAAQLKGIDSPVSGATDIAVLPGLEAGNILYKSLVYISKATAGGVVMGAKIPVILTSRADSVHSRISSAAVARLVNYTARNPGHG